MKLFISYELYQAPSNIKDGTKITETPLVNLYSVTIDIF